jgi:hypothetical protein
MSNVIKVLEFCSKSYICVVSQSTWLPEQDVDYEEVKKLLDEIGDNNFMFDFGHTLYCHSEESVLLIADSFGFVKQPLSIYQKMAFDWSDEFYQEMRKRDIQSCPYEFDEASSNTAVFDETIQILEQLGCSIYVGDSLLVGTSLSLSFRQKYFVFRNGGEGGKHLKLTSGKDVFYFSSKWAIRNYLWHEAWHYLQHNPPQGFDASSFSLDESGACSILSKDMFREGMHRLFSRDYSEETYAYELPAFAVQHEPDFVVSILKKLAETKLKQQGLFDLIFKKCSFSPLVESYKNGPKDHIYRNFFAVVMKHYIVTKDNLEWTIQVRYLGSNPEPITLLEFCRQNEFVIPKHLL